MSPVSRGAESLVSYVPALVARRVARQSEPPTEARAELVTAAVLFADISGFTALTEALARHGAQGAEELTQNLNIYFGQLIDLITAHGGDIIKFAGDALIAVWPAGDADLADATIRAAQCGLAAQARLYNFSAAGDVRLSLRIGIGAGPVSVFHVGGVEGRWECVATGASLGQMSTAKEQDQPGEVTLSPEAWSLVSSRAEGQTLPGGAVTIRQIRDAIPLVPLSLPSVGDPPALLAYVPPSVVHHLESQESGWLAELRTVTVLFVNFPGLTPLTPLDRAQGVMQTLQAILKRYEAVINKLSVDDKGASLVAALGLPGFAHEDDPARGVSAALAIRDRLREINVRHAIGIATGTAFCGVVGNAIRREYTMIGDVVNLSARLMQAAPDSVLCDQTTYEGSRGRIAFEALPAIHLKGKSGLISVYRPHGGAVDVEEPRRAHTSAIIGRLAERQAINEALLALKDRDRRGTVILEGEAGIGKSRLVDELSRHARAAGIAALLGDADAMEKGTPYYPWRGVFLQLFELEPAASQGQRADRVVERIAAAGRSDWTDRLPLLNPVLMVELPESPATQSMNERDRAAATQEFLTDLLVNLRGVPAKRVVILEDAQWMDSSSWKLALRVSGLEAPLLLVLPARSMSEELDAIAQLPGTRRVWLGPLPADEANDVARQILGVARLPQPVEHIIVRAEGNPLFIEELIQAMRESELIHVADGECRIDAADESLQSVQLPETVQAAVVARVDRLSASQRTLLKVASVVGRVFEPFVVEHLHPIDADGPSIADDLRSLTTMQITALDRADPPRYAFSQLIFQEVNYNLMLFSQRRQLHRAMAEWLEQFNADRLDAVYPLLATHWSRAVDETSEPALLLKAADYLHKAGQQAVRQYANHEAVAFLSEGLRLIENLPETPERVRTELALSCAIGTPLLATRGFAAPETERAYARAWALCKGTSDTPQRFDTVLGLWVFYLVKTELRRARELAEELVRIANASGNPELLLPAHRVMGDTAFWLGDHVTSREHFDRAIAIYRPELHHAASVARNGQDPGVICRALSAWNLWLLGYPDSALTRMEESLALAHRLAHPFSVAMALQNFTMTYQFRREPKAALEKAEQLIEVSRDGGFALWTAGGTIMRGWALAELGQPEFGRSEMERGIEEWKATGAELPVGYYVGLLATSYGEAGQAEKGLELIRTALAAANRSGEAWWLPELWRIEAELSLAKANPDFADAERCVREAIHLARRQRARSLELRAVMSEYRMRRTRGSLNDESRRALIDMRRGFTEGRETRDLKEADELLDH